MSSKVNIACKFNLGGICGNNKCKQFCFTCIGTRRCHEYEFKEEIIPNRTLEGLINTLEIGLDFGILDKDGVKVLETKIAEEKAVVGRISYIGPKGKAVETISFTNKEWMDRAIYDAQEHGVPIAYEHYAVEAPSPPAEEPLDIDAVLVERDYKGEYERFALTPEAFDDEYGDFAESEEGTFTIRPMIHIWYQAVKVKDDSWNQFFTNLTRGLPESDKKAGNIASIRKDMVSPELLKYI